MDNTTRPTTYPGPSRAQLMAMTMLATLMVALVLVAAVTNPVRAYAAEATVGLGTATSYSVLAGQTVTNTGPTVLGDDLGVSPGTAVTGFPPGIVGGAIHAGDAVADQAQSDLITAYNDAAGRASDGAITADLGDGPPRVGGIYTASSSAQLTGTLTLDGQGDPNSVFIFQIGSTLTTATNSSVNLINGAQACNVFFQVGSSATLGVGTDFIGTILALTSITLNTGARVDGRALARNGSVTLDSNVFTSSACDVSTPTPSASSSETVEPTPTPTVDETSVPTPTPTVDETSVPTPTPTVDETSSVAPSASETETQPAADDSSTSDSGTDTGDRGSGTNDDGSGSGDDEGSGLTGGSGSLADTGSGGLLSVLGPVGALLVLAAVTILAVVRFRSQPMRRH